ncbi:MAG: hypothetical protein ACI9WU_001787 [Myxococcota bacterium]|jgi:hypothetical protein
MIGALLLGLSLGCSAAPIAERPNPEAARAAWLEALSSGEPAKVWAMLGDHTRSAWADQTAFDAWCRRRCPDLLVSAAGSTGPLVETLDFGQGLSLSLHDGKWRVRDRRRLGARTISEALTLFLERGGGLLSSRAAATLSSAIAAPASAVQTEGDRATISLPSGASVDLVRQKSGWRVDRWNSRR